MMIKITWKFSQKILKNIDLISFEYFHGGSKFCWMNWHCLVKFVLYFLTVDTELRYKHRHKHICMCACVLKDTKLKLYFVFMGI